MTRRLVINYPSDLPGFQLPMGVQARLNDLLDCQDCGETLTDAERDEAEGLVSLAETLSLLGLPADRAIHE